MPGPIRIIGQRSKRPAPPAEIVDTTSRSVTWSKGLSPFFLGPVDLYYKFVAKNVENAWQFSKVYAEHVNAEGNPTSDWWQWAVNGWTDDWAHRFPMGKGAKPLYSAWHGEKLGYIDARKQIYAPLYAKAVQKSEAYQKLKELYNSTTELVLVDFDGYDHLALGMSLTDVLNNPQRKMGHAFVLAALLTDDPSMKEWKSWDIK